MFIPGLLLASIILYADFTRFTLGDTCILEKTCTRTCYTSSMYTASCGTWGWRRCNRYRQISYSCQQPCNEEVCCEGYGGVDCTTPICFDSTTCANGGTCVSPDNCICTRGYSQPACEDIDECATELDICAHICNNTQGSYTCNCNDGYMLQSDLTSCSDIDECVEENGRCNQVCVNSEGSYSCACNQGYELSADGLTCTDKDECANSTHECEHGCTNTLGSFGCYCHTGYELGLDERSCDDLDECVNETPPCDHICVNTRGSYECDCNSGYERQPDRVTCKDIDECSTNNGGCGQICTNHHGGHTCSCLDGYRLIQNNQCEDIDECENDMQCGQTCTNTIGSFTCGCKEGYKLDTDDRSCYNIDDCANISCQNGGCCIDGLSSFICVCLPGFTEKLCELDINECSFLNGGCNDICTNTLGSFTCSCKGNRSLAADQRSCEGGDFSGTSVFERLRIHRKLLPVGCFLFNIDDVRVLTSTLPWYCLRYDQSICYTLGVVHIKIKGREHPISIQGLAITNKDLLTISSNPFPHADGSITEQETECKEIKLSDKDILDLVREGSFIRSYMSLIPGSLPSWIDISVVQPRTLSVQDMKSEFRKGSEIPTTQWCAEAPVIHGRVYNVFRFSTDLRIDIYGESVYIPRPTSGEMLCLVADVSNNHNGTLFVMIPERLSKSVNDLTAYLGTKRHPTGLGISMEGAMHVNDESLAFWNGYKTFTPTLPSPSLWVGSHTEIPMFIIKFEGKENYFKSTSNIETVLASVDSYSSISTLDITVAPSFNIHVLGESFTEILEGILSLDIDLYRLEQGSDECDENVVPDGFYFSLKSTVNPFKNVPILRHWSQYQDPTQVMDVLIGCRWTEPSPLKISSFLANLNETIGNLLEMEDELLFSDLPEQLFQEVITFQSVINRYNETSYGGRDQRMFLQDVWLLYKNIKRQVTLLQDTVEFSASQTTDFFMSNVSENIEKVKIILNEMIKQLDMQSRSLSICTSIGLKYTAEISLFFGKDDKIKLGWFNVEVLYSENMLQCSRFDDVAKLLKGHSSLRVIGQASRNKDIGRFLELEIGGGLGLAMALDNYNAVMQFNSFIKILGVVCTVDTFVTFEGIFVYYETNIWNIFYSQIDVRIIHESFDNLLFDVKGRFVVNKRKKRQTQTRTDSFSDTYLNGLKKVINFVADEVNKRITLVQNSFTDAQQLLSKAQAFLNKMESAFVNGKEIFDKAEAALVEAKRKVDETMKPYLRAVEELNQRKKDVDNLCRIKKCNSFCIPGIRCRICSKKIWFVRVYYPCCYFSRCMFRIPDPICVIRNIACRIIREIAFLALEVAKIFVRAAMIPFDIAKLALTAAEFVVEKSRLSLEIAEHVFGLAQLALEMTKVYFEMIKLTLEAVKMAVRAAASVLQMIITHGLQNVVDVRNCGFNVEISDRDLPIFQVYCDVNLFRLGWRKVVFPVNFLHPYLSIYQAAKATVKTAMRILSDWRRKKKSTSSTSFKAFSIIYSHLRHSRSTDIDIVYINETLGFESKASTDYDHRTELFAHKCQMIAKIEEFMSTSFEYLYTLSNDSSNIYSIGDEFEAELSHMDINAFTQNLTFENMGVSRDYARMDYNLTDEEIDAAEEKAKNEVMNNSIINDFSERVNASRENAATELNNVESFDFSGPWFALMNNFTKQYFEEDICAGFQDCLLHCFTELYSLYEEEEVPHVDLIQNAIMQLDENVTSMFLKTNIAIKEMVSTMKFVVSTLEDLMKLNPFCSIPPNFRLELKNITAVVGSDVEFFCDAIGDPEPDIRWYRNSEIIQGERMTYLVISNISRKDEAAYYCVAGNVVANLSSNEARLFVIEYKGQESAVYSMNDFIYVVIATAAASLVCIVICCLVLQKNVSHKQENYQESSEVQQEKTSKKTSDTEEIDQNNFEIGSTYVSHKQENYQEISEVQQEGTSKKTSDTEEIDQNNFEIGSKYVSHKQENYQEISEVQQEGTSKKTSDTEEIDQNNFGIGSKDEDKKYRMEVKIPGLIKVQEAPICIEI